MHYKYIAGTRQCCLSIPFVLYDICWIVVIIVELVCWPNITITQYFHFFFAYSISGFPTHSHLTSNFNDSIENLKFKYILQCHIMPTPDNAIPAVFCMFSFYL